MTNLAGYGDHRRGSNFVVFDGDFDADGFIDITDRKSQRQSCFTTAIVDDGVTNCSFHRCYSIAILLNAKVL